MLVSLCRPSWDAFSKEPEGWSEGRCICGEWEAVRRGGRAWRPGRDLQRGVGRCGRLEMAWECMVTAEQEHIVRMGRLLTRRKGFMQLTAINDFATSFQGYFNMKW